MNPTTCLLTILITIALNPLWQCCAQEENGAREKPSSRVGKRFVHPDTDKMVSTVRISPDGSTIIGSTYPENNIQLWDVDTGEPKLLIDSPDEGKASMDFWRPSVDFSRLYLWTESKGLSARVERDGRKGIVKAYPDSQIQVWDLEEGSKKLIKKPDNQVRNLTISPNQKFMISHEELAGTFFGLSERTTRVLNLETNQWTDIGSNFPFALRVDHSGQRIATFEFDESKRYVTGIVVKQFPDFEDVINFKLPDGFHGLGYLRFCDNDRYLVAYFRTFPKKGTQKKWKTTIICIDLQTGKQVGEYQFPIENDSPMFFDGDLADNTLGFGTWLNTTKTCFGLSLPSLEPKWQIEIGEYKNARETLVSPDKKWVAVICAPDSEFFRLRGRVEDWSNIPLNELKIISFDGRILDTIKLPVGCQTIAKGADGTIAIGALGAAYLLNLDPPFQLEVDPNE